MYRRIVEYAHTLTDRESKSQSHMHTDTKKGQTNVLES